MSRDRVMQAVQSGDLDALDALLSQDSEWARGTPNAGWLAAQSGRADVLQVIGRHHPSSLVELSNGLTPATAAALAGHAGVLRALAALAPESLETFDQTGQAPVHHAVAAGHVAVLAVIAEHAPHALDMPSATGMTPMDVAWNLGHEQCVELLIEQGIESVADKWDCACVPGESCEP